MGTASLILGIVSLVISFIPLLGSIAIFPAITGFVLGIVDLVKKSKSGGKKGMSIAGLILSVVAVIIIVFYVFGIAMIASLTANDYENTYSNSVSTWLDNINDSSENNIICQVGESATVDDMKVTFLSVNTNFTDYNKYATVKSGYKVIKTEFELENMSTSSNLVSSYDFHCYADGYVCGSFYSVTDSSFSSNLSSGKKYKGSVYYLVPTNADTITIEYDGNTYIDGKITFEVK